MSIIKPQIEYVDRASQSIRYLEHGWPTDLCRWHAHEEYELHLIVDTRGKAFVGDYIGEFAPGSLYLTGPNVPHNWITHDTEQPAVPIRDMLVQFSDASMTQLSAVFPEFQQLEALFEQSRFGIEFVGFDAGEAQQMLAKVRDSSGAERIVAMLALLVAINAHPEKKALSLATLAANAPGDRNSRIGAVVDHIVANYAESVSVEDAAQIAGMSVSAFSRNFLAVTGNRFVEFVNRVRIGQACSMLYSSDAQVSAICYEVGFQNLANFNRQFLKMKNMTPSAYRQIARQELVAQPKVAKPMYETAR